MSVGSDFSPPPDLGHWVYGDRVHLCLTPQDDGRICVRITVPKGVIGDRAVHVNYDEGYLVTEFEPRELAIDYAGCVLRGTRMASSEFASYRVGFELDLEPAMVDDVVAALRSARQLARLLRSQLFESLGTT